MKKISKYIFPFASFNQEFDVSKVAPVRNRLDSLNKNNPVSKFKGPVRTVKF